MAPYAATSIAEAWMEVGHDVLRGLVRHQVAHEHVRAFAASQAAEHAARLATMEGAERSVEERLGKLWHAAEQERQNAVTEELLDVQALFRASDSGVT